MTSDRQILANRRNALKSTGPRTAAGKGKVRANALKHGLSARTQGSRVDPRALQLAALAVDPQAADAAAKQRLWAEAHAELERADAYRQNIMATALLRLDAGADGSAGDVGMIIDQLVRGLRRLQRYERRLHARLRRLEGVMLETDRKVTKQSQLIGHKNSTCFDQVAGIVQIVSDWSKKLARN
jgi:hypothetical protein